MYKGLTVNSNRGGVLLFSNGFGCAYSIHHKNSQLFLQAIKISILFTEISQ